MNDGSGNGNWIEWGVALIALLSFLTAGYVAWHTISTAKEAKRNDLRDRLGLLMAEALELSKLCREVLRAIPGLYGNLNEESKTVVNLRSIQKQAGEIYVAMGKHEDNLANIDVSEVIRSLGQIRKGRITVEGEKSRIGNVVIKDFSEVSRVLPTWFSERMMGDTWRFGLVTADGRTIGINNITEVTGNGKWMTVNLLTDDEIPKGIDCITAVANDRRTASVQVSNIVMAYELITS